MAIDYDNEPYVSPKQQKLWDTLDELSFKFQELIEAKRKIALNKLIDESSSSKAKTEELNSYFAFRMEPNAYAVKADNGSTYSLAQMKEIALSLLEDKTFFYNDYPLILNNLDPFFESITLEDIILAYHNYRLSEDDESLSHLAKLMGLYTKKAFEMDELDIEFRVSDEILSHQESITHLKKIVTFLDDYLQRYKDKRTLFYGMYKLEKKEENYDFSSRFYKKVDQSLGKRSPLEIRASKLTAFLLSNGSFDASDEIEVSRLLRKLYEPIAATWLSDKQDEPNGAKIGIVNTIECNELSSIQWPTFTDLYEIVENEYKNEVSRAKSIRRSYQHIIDCLNNIRDRYSESAVNEKIPIAKEDFDEAAENASEIDTQSAFENIQMHIRLLFIALMVTEGIPEFAAEKDKMKWRKTTCRKLCDIFSDDDSFENIQEEDGINEQRMVKNENRINIKKNELYKSFLMLYDKSSIELIMENRLKLLDRAKTIDPLDTAFLEKCSASILEKLRKAMHDENLFHFVEPLRKELNSGKTIQVSDDVLHTLATAEFLFTKYATDEFAEQGFDYSSISALYYQAFENAYNELIWRKYADKLNALIIEGTPFTTIIESNRYCNIKKDHIAFGYLTDNPKGRKHYVSYKDGEPDTLRINACMRVLEG